MGGMNIQHLLQLLKDKAQMTDSEIGIAVGAPQSIISRLRHGKHKQTSFDRGMAIYKLAKDKGVVNHTE